MLRGALGCTYPQGTLSSRTYSNLIIRGLMIHSVCDSIYDLIRDLILYGTGICSIYALIIIISPRIRSAHMLSISGFPPMKYLPPPSSSVTPADLSTRAAAQTQRLILLLVALIPHFLGGMYQTFNLTLSCMQQSESNIDYLQSLASDFQPKVA